MPCGQRARVPGGGGISVPFHCIWGEGLYLALERSREAVRGREALFQPCGPGEEAGGRPVPSGGEP